MLARGTEAFPTAHTRVQQGMRLCQFRVLLIVRCRQARDGYTQFPMDTHTQPHPPWGGWVGCGLQSSAAGPGSASPLGEVKNRAPSGTMCEVVQALVARLLTGPGGVRSGGVVLRCWSRCEVRLTGRRHGQVRVVCRLPGWLRGPLREHVCSSRSLSTADCRVLVGLRTLYLTSRGYYLISARRCQDIFSLDRVAIVVRNRANTKQNERKTSGQGGFI